MDNFDKVIAEAHNIVDEALPPTLNTTSAAPDALRDADTVAGRIDHTLLKAEATAEAVIALCLEAREHGFASVCVNSRWVPLASAQLAGSSVMVCTVVGFPLGATTRRAKAEEARVAISEGAAEVDMVIDIGGMLSNKLIEVYEDIAGVVEAAKPAPVKVILETHLLTPLQIAVACILASRAGAAYVKTSTGFGGGGATVSDIALLRAVVGKDLGVKASGGVRTVQDANALLKAGADRIGASASVAIVTGAAAGTGAY